MLQGIAEAVYVNRVVLRNHPGRAFVQLFTYLDRNQKITFCWPFELTQESGLILPGHEPCMDDKRLCRKTVC